MPPAQHPLPTAPPGTPTFGTAAFVVVSSVARFPHLDSRMSSTSHEASMPPQPEGDSSFWQLLALLAQEPDLRWLAWLLCQREAQARAHATPPPRSRSRPPFPATFPSEDPAAAAEEEEEEGAPSPGGAAGGQHRPANDCPVCRDQASRHLGPEPLEALRLLERSAHPRIWKMYRKGLSRFCAFREQAGLPSAWPIPRDQIIGFLVALDSQHLSSLKIFGYLAGLSYLSRMWRFPDPLQDFVVSRMAVALHRQGDIQRRGWTPLPVEMLRCLVGMVDSVCTTFYSCTLFRAVFILAWFAALRPEEFVAEEGSSVDPPLLHLRDFEFSEHDVDIQLRVLGVGPERFTFHLTRAREPWLCPILALSNYLAARPRREGPFFIHDNGEPLTKGQFLAVFDPALRLLGLLPQQFSLHSFWLGAVRSAVKYQLSEELIQQLARWPKRGNSHQ